MENLITARDLLIVIQESQPKLDVLYTNNITKDLLKFIQNKGFIMVPTETVERITKDAYLRMVFDPVTQRDILDKGYIGTFATMDRKSNDVAIPIYAPEICNVDYNSSHDFLVVFTPQNYDRYLNPKHQFAHILNKGVV